MQCYAVRQGHVVGCQLFQSAICADMQCYKIVLVEAGAIRKVSVRYLRGYAVLPARLAA